MPVEPARGKDDAGAQRDGACARGGFKSDDPALGRAADLGDVRIGDNLDICLESRGQEPCDQGVAHDKSGTASKPQAIEEISAHEAGGMEERRDGPREIEEMRDVVTIDHEAAKDRQLR